MRGTYSHQQPHEPMGTVALLLVTGIVSAADLIMGGTLIGYGAKSAAIWAGEFHRLLTPSFLHLDVEHLLVNLYLLLIFGPQVERVVGTPRFLALYLLTGAFGLKRLRSHIFN